MFFLFFFLQAEADGAANAKKQLRLSYEDYRKIANLVVHYLRKNDSDDIQKSAVQFLFFIKSKLGNRLEQRFSNWGVAKYFISVAKGLLSGQFTSDSL